MTTTEAPKGGSSSVPLPILTYPDPLLKQPAEPVTDFDDQLRLFIEQLEATRLAGPAAVGIAAPQVGRLQRVAIVDVSGSKQARKEQPHGRIVMVNPEIVDWREPVIGREGCLSVPDFTGNVIRARHVTVQARDGRGEPWELALTGYEARAVQHEIDHLDGILFLDRLVSRRADLFQRRNYSS